MEAALVAFGVILGTVMSELSFSLREWRTDKKAAKRVRTMINVEIAQNLDLATDYLDFLMKDYVDYGAPPGYGQPPPDDMSLVHAWRLVSFPIPAWSSAMWESQLSELTTALSEKQIMQCHRHYGHIDTVASVRAILVELRVQSTAQRQDETKTGSVIRDRYTDEAPEIWAKCERSLRMMLSAGNPLADEVERMTTAKLYSSEADQAATADD